MTTVGQQCLEPVAQMVLTLSRAINTNCLALPACRGRVRQSCAVQGKCLLSALVARGSRNRDQCSSDFTSHSSDPSLHNHSPAPAPIPDASHQRRSPIRKSMYPSPPLSTRTFFSFCPSVSVAAVLGFSEGLSNTLPFRVARTLPGRGQRCCQCLCSAPLHLTHTNTTRQANSFCWQNLEVTAV